MGRKIVLKREGESAGKILEEVQAHDEAQLQEQLKENPDLLPIEEYELPGPLMVVGRETPLPSGSVDLICLTRTGELLLVEFKTGPKNPDFRHTLAQLLDYGLRFPRFYGHTERQGDNTLGGVSWRKDEGSSRRNSRLKLFAW